MTLTSAATVVLWNGNCITLRRQPFSEATYDHFRSGNGFRERKFFDFWEVAAMSE